MDESSLTSSVYNITPDSHLEHNSQTNGLNSTVGSTEPSRALSDKSLLYSDSTEEVSSSLRLTLEMKRKFIQVTCLVRTDLVPFLRPYAHRFSTNI